MKKILILAIVVIFTLSCEKEHVGPSDLTSTFWFTPVDQNHLTDITQLHWNINNDLFIWRWDASNETVTQREGYSRMDGCRVLWQEIINGKVSDSEVWVFDVATVTDKYLWIVENGVRIKLITLD